MIRLAAWLRDRLGTRRDSVGRRGERAAAGHLKARGYRVLARNVRNRSGELDLVAQAPDGKTIVFVEVKSGGGGPILPEVRVDRDKRRRLVALAAQFARRHRLTDRPLRFDVIGVDFTDARSPRIRHHVAAFESPV